MRRGGERNTGNREDGEKSAAERLVEVLRMFLLRQLKAAITKEEYSKNGSIGGRVDLAKKKIEGVRAGGSVDSRRRELREAAALLKDAQNEKTRFRVEREQKSAEDEVRQWVGERRGAYEKNYADIFSTKGMEDRRGNYDGIEQDYGQRKRSEQQVLDQIDQREGDEQEQLAGQARNRYKTGKKRVDEEVRQADKSIEDEIVEQIAEISKLEADNNELRNASGLFVADKDVISALQARESAFIEALRDDPKSAKLHIKEMRKMVADSVDDGTLGSEVRRTLYKDIRRLEKDNAMRMAGMSGAEGAELTDQDRDRNQIEQERILDQMASGRMRPEEGLGRIRALEQGISRQQLDRYLRMRSGGGARPEDLLGGMGEINWDLLDMPFSIEPDQDRPDRMMMQSPDYYYDMAKRSAEREYQSEGGLSEQAFEDYVWRMASKILSSGRSSYEGQDNQVTRVILETMWSSEDVLRPTELRGWGVSIEHRDELKDQIHGLLAMNDFQYMHKHASREQIAKMAEKGTMSEYGHMHTANMDLGIVWEKEGGGQVDPAEVNLHVGNMIEMMKSKHWYTRGLSQRDHIRNEGRRDMVLYAIASQLPGWRERMVVDGVVDYSGFRVEEMEDRQGYRVWMEGSSDKYIIKGYEDVRGGHDLYELMHRGQGFAAFAQEMIKADQTAYNYAVLFNADLNEADAKYVGNDYQRKFGRNIVASPDMMEAIAPRRGGVEGELYKKELKPLYKLLSKQNGKKYSEKDIANAIDHLIRNREGFMLTREQMLTNWDALMVDRKISGMGGKKRSRYFYMRKDEQNRVNGVIDKIIYDRNFDWTEALMHFTGKSKQELAASGTAIKGGAGFKSVVKNMTREKMFNTDKLWDRLGEARSEGSYLDNDLDPAEGSDQNNWRKYFDYNFRIAKGFGARPEFAKRPTLDNKGKLMMAGQYDWSDKRYTDEIMYHAHIVEDGMINTKFNQEVIETVDGDIQFEKDEHGKYVRDEEGQLIIKTKRIMIDASARDQKKDTGEKAHMFKALNDKSLKEEWVTPAMHAIIRGERLEKIPLIGWPPEGRLMLGRGKWAVNLWGWDPMGWAREVPGLRYFSRRIRIGPGPILGWMRVEASYVPILSVIGLTLAGWLQVAGQAAKEELDNV